LIEQKQIDIAPLITHRYTSFADVEKHYQQTFTMPSMLKAWLF
jgi:hypothetical protein